MYVTKSVMDMYKEAGIEEEKALEIEKAIYDLYPVSKKELQCAMEKAKRDWLRTEKRKKETGQEKKNYDHK